MPDYSNGKIYKIVNEKNDKIYIGSTIQPLSKRFWTHRCYALTERFDSEFYKDIRENGIDCFKILLIKTYECKCKDELEAEEYRVIQEEKIKGTGLYNIKTEKDKLAVETKQKLSEAHKGENHPMYGKNHTEGTRRKMSEAHKGENHTEETKLKMSETRKGKNNPNFNYGCISHRKILNYFVFQYNVNGKRKSKSFSYGLKRTETQALEECKKFRKTIYPDCKDKN